MKRKQLLTAVLLLVAGTAMAQNALQVEDFTLPQNGGDIAMTLTLDEADKYVSYQFKIETPAGVAYVVDSDNDVECVLGTGHDASHAAKAHWNANDKLLSVGVASFSSALFKGKNLELQIPLAATTAAIGTQFTFTVKDITFIDKGGIKSYLSNVTFTATVGAAEVKRTLLDENSTTAPEAKASADVRVKRTINANEWSTICLPFAMTATQVKAAFGNDVQLGDFAGYDVTDGGKGISVKFTSATAIAANRPYIIKVGAAVSEFTVDGVDVNPQEAKVNYGTIRKPKAFIGNYVAGTVIENGCLFLNSSKFWYSVGSTKIKAFRAYFNFDDLLPDFEDNYAAAPVAISFDGNMTDINAALDKRETTTGSVIYNLNGQRVESPKKGLYIINNKKVVVK